MGKQKSYVAGIVDAVRAMELFIKYTTSEVVAETFLRSTLVDYPRPPWQTGALRRSGVVYIGGRKYMTTNELGRGDLLGSNPEDPYGYLYQIGALKTLDAGQGLPSGESYSSPKTLKLSKVKFKEQGSGNISTLRNKVTVMYQAPHAALMHEWPGQFSDIYSGAHFVSSKALMSMTTAALRIKRLYGQRFKNMTPSTGPWRYMR